MDETVLLFMLLLQFRYLEISSPNKPYPCNPKDEEPVGNNIVYGIPRAGQFEEEFCKPEYEVDVEE